jgi:hypothetical protein
MKCKGGARTLSELGFVHGELIQSTYLARQVLAFFHPLNNQQTLTIHEKKSIRSGCNPA